MEYPHRYAIESTARLIVPIFLTESVTRLIFHSSISANSQHPIICTAPTHRKILHSQPEVIAAYILSRQNIRLLCNRELCAARQTLLSDRERDSNRTFENSINRNSQHLLVTSRSQTHPSENMLPFTASLDKQFASPWRSQLFAAHYFHLFDGECDSIVLTSGSVTYRTSGPAR